MKKQVLISVLFSLAACSIFGQSYKSAGGLRLGGGSDFNSAVSLTYCHHLFENNTIEGIANLNLKKTDRFGLTALYKTHHKIIGRGTNFFVGGGVHYYFANKVEAADFKNPAGLTGIIGLEASLGKINISFDWKPEFHLVGSGKSFDSGAAISARYIFEKRERKKIFSKPIFKRKEKSKQKGTTKKKWF